MTVGENLFLQIQVFTGNPFIDSTMYFLAEFLVLLIPLTFIYLWFQDREGKEDSVFAAYSTVLGILTTYLLGLFYAHQNPSATYETIIAYHPENSFPSQHTAAMFGAAFPLLYRHREKLGYLMVVVAVLTGFSRVYIGEHWPIDILGSALAAGIGLGVAHFSWDILEPVWRPILDQAEKLEGKAVEKLL
jgi:undecaprenyl-diphosphatase